MRTNVLWAILVLSLVTLSQQIISYRDLGHLTQREVEADPYVEVYESSTSKLNDLYREYFILKVVEKEKRLAYYKMTKIYEKVLKILKRFQLIPDEDSLVKTKIKPQFLSKKRRWSFSIIFVVGGEEDELTRCYRELIKVGIQKLSTHPSINFLHEKVQAMEVFNSAKLKLIRQLKRFPSLKIKEVEKIEITGIKIENSDIIEEQIEQEFSNSEEMIDEDEFAEIKSVTESTANQGLVEMRIIFKIGEVDEESYWDEDAGDDDYESENSEAQY